jgi:radical SAM superfamily enzyme YgiQ (UPF0313 family)
MRIRELNVVRKKKYNVSIALLFPSTYQASLSSLALQILYFYLNQHEELFAERIVSDINDGTRSIETGKSLAKFDYVLVLSSYELDYPVAINMMQKAGISPMRENRDKPIVIWGGSSPTANPWALHRFADAVLRGEAEVFLDSLIEHMLSATEKKQFLNSLSSVDEAWISGIKEEGIIGRVSNLDDAFFPLRQIQSLDIEPFLGRAFILEPSRGCARGCRFCMESAVLGARRERSLSKLISYIDEGVEVNNVSKVAFYTLSFFDSPTGERLLEYLVEKNLEGSVPSVRADSLDEHKVELIKRIGQRVITIAPETPSDKLQALINKMISWDTVMDVSKWCRKNNLFIKLYYMYGLPNEDEEDLELIVSQVRAVRDIMGSRESVRVSIVPFTPKPMTLLWREKMLGLKELRKRERFLKERLRVYARIESYPPKLSRMQYEINMLGKEAWKYILGLANISIDGMSKAREVISKGGLEEIG